MAKSADKFSSVASLVRLARRSLKLGEPLAAIAPLKVAIKLSPSDELLNLLLDAFLAADMLRDALSYCPDVSLLRQVGVGTTLRVLRIYARSGLAVSALRMAVDLNDCLGIELFAKALSEITLWASYHCDFTTATEARRLWYTIVLSDQGACVDPYAAFTSFDSPEFHHKVGRGFTGCLNTKTLAPHVVSHSNSPSKLKLGFLGKDFFNHPTSLLLHKFVSLLDRDVFQVVGFDYSPDDGSLAREQMLHSFDAVVSLHGSDDGDAARLIKRKHVDVLIDTAGYTEGARPGILACRPARIQTGYLGYVGTAGSHWLDFYLCDDYCIPQDENKNWSETIAYLPGCYYPGSTWAVSPAPRVSIDSNKHFLFGSFNSVHKIQRSVLLAWAAILDAVPRSKLRILVPNRSAADALLRSAPELSLLRERIEFAFPISHSSHLNRLAEIDLALDTFPYGGHTTSADLLHARVPVLTISGRSLPSRVAGSLLTNLRMSELIARDLSEYVLMAIAIATNKKLYATIASKLDKEVAESSLFDPHVYAESFKNTILRQILQIK